LYEWINLILEHLKGKNPKLDLPLAVSFTPFQGKVWEKLREIPYGSTCSYLEVALAVGNPKGARAVARACASNPVALLIPCHRVVRGNGELGGYRWGLERKRTLLEREQENISVAEKAV
jgi:AraC family transcriptional regulator of adaptative response/methylated-DNA-[protein]-cysteine methyltransferase